MIFVDVKNLENVYRLEDVCANPKLLLMIFLTHEWDVIYISKCDSLFAIVSVGDIYRYYENENDNFIFNTKFSYVSEINFEDANKIFDRIKTICEVPIIKQGRFIGIIRKNENHTDKHWEHIHYKLESINNSLFLVDELKRWMKKRNGIDLYIYENPGNIRQFLGDRDKVEFEKKIRLVHEPNFDSIKWGKEHGFCVERLCLKAVSKSGVVYFEDYHGKNLNIAKRHRVTPNSKKGCNKIFFLGVCTSFGAHVGDTETIEYYVQEKINRSDYSYEVINCSLMGSGHIEQGLFIEGMKKGDIVVISFPGWGKYDKDIIKRNFSQQYKGELSEVYSKITKPNEQWVDCPAHCNGIVNKKIAERIWKDICMDSDRMLKNVVNEKRMALQDYYIPYGIHRYFDEFIAKYCLSKDIDGKVGAIVMNCNPFTKGHKYLIERACEYVKFLYIFVVEEDKSYYSFHERFEMVKRGVADLANIKVLPSGRFILSKDTFAQYFDKESVTEVEDMSWDIRIFGEVVAKKLGISHRFVGEEPKDIVTREYNERMKKILPEYDIEVIEIPRVHTLEDDEVISATTVRKLVKENEWEQIKKYCPESTINYLKKKGSL